jgi:hypothetical protein
MSSGTNERLQREAAFRRIGSTTVGNLKWLLFFTNADLGDVPSTEWPHLQQEITAFIQLGIIQLQRDLTVEDVQWLVNHPIETSLVQTLGDRGHVIRLKGAAAKIIKQFVDGNDIELPPVTLRRFLTKTPQGWQKCIIPSRPEDAFIERLLFVLQEAGTDMSRCQANDCKKLFVKQRIDQRFCSDTCRSRIAMRTKRSKETNNRRRRR